jgi:hypothetical protein
LRPKTSSAFLAGAAVGVLLFGGTGRLWSVDPPNAAPRSRAASAETALSTGTIQISDVVGLTNELAIRPQEGVDYTYNTLVYSDPSGLLESVNGNPLDCVRVNGSANPCSTNEVDGEVPSGAINGTNAIFSLANPPIPPNSLRLYRNGLRLQPVLEYSLSGATITFSANAVPQIGDTLLADYTP